MPESKSMSYPTLRVRALIVSDGHVLLARLQSRPVAFLPGGRVEPGEPIADALKREVREECGVAAERIEYLGAVENVWSENGRRIHDLSHFFLVESAALRVSFTPQCNDDGVELCWVAAAQVQSEPVKPESVKRLLCGWLDGQRDAWWAYEQEA
jgi:8-oxo-dGTP diphosphatase